MILMAILHKRKDTARVLYLEPLLDGRLDGRLEGRLDGRLFLGEPPFGELDIPISAPVAVVSSIRASNDKLVNA